jgi:hypothetical protein
MAGHIDPKSSAEFLVTLCASVPFRHKTHEGRRYYDMNLSFFILGKKDGIILFPE